MIADSRSYPNHGRVSVLSVNQLQIIIIFIIISWMFCAVDCCLFEYSLSRFTHNRRSVLRSRVCTFFHTIKHMFDYIWLKINRPIALLSLLVCVRFLFCSPIDVVSVKRSVLYTHHIARVKLFIGPSIQTRIHTMATTTTHIRSFNESTQTGAWGNVFVHVLHSWWASYPISVLSRNSIECSCHSAGRVLSLLSLFLWVPPTK